LLEAGRAFIGKLFAEFLADFLADFFADFLAAGGKPIRTINRALRRKNLYMLAVAWPRSSGDRATAF
jgi:hypothetical protein